MKRMVGTYVKVKKTIKIAMSMKEEGGVKAVFIIVLGTSNNNKCVITLKVKKHWTIKSVQTAEIN